MSPGRGHCCESPVASGKHRALRCGLTAEAQSRAGDPAPVDRNPQRKDHSLPCKRGRPDGWQRLTDTGDPSLGCTRGGGDPPQPNAGRDTPGRQVFLSLSPRGRGRGGRTPPADPPRPAQYPRCAVRHSGEAGGVQAARGWCWGSDPFPTGPSGIQALLGSLTGLRSSPVRLSLNFTALFMVDFLPSWHLGL